MRSFVNSKNDWLFLITESYKTEKKKQSKNLQENASRQKKVNFYSIIITLKWEFIRKCCSLVFFFFLKAENQYLPKRFSEYFFAFLIFTKCFDIHRHWIVLIGFHQTEEEKEEIHEMNCGAVRTRQLARDSWNAIQSKITFHVFWARSICLWTSQSMCEFCLMPATKINSIFP